MNIQILDTLHLGLRGIVAATALETSEGIALFDTGPESTFENVVAALRNSGFEPTDVRHVFLSHIHFDHAGAAWRFAQSLGPRQTGATIYVHPRGAPHLVDPRKLIESARRIFGDEMQRLWGKTAPVPPERLKILEDNDVIRLSPFEIRAIATPGHASHHHVYHWQETLFGGDVAGVRIRNGPPIPPFVPPELQIESWLESIAKMQAVNAASLYLPHYGKISGPVADHLDALAERVSRWSEWFRQKIKTGAPETTLVPEFTDYEHADLRAGGASNEDVEGYEAADPSHMAVSASVRYWKKYHAEALL